MKLEKFIAVLKVAFGIISLVALFVSIIRISSADELVDILSGAVAGHCAILSFWFWIPKNGNICSEDENTDDRNN